MVGVEGRCDGLIAVFAIERGYVDGFTHLVTVNPRVRKQILETPLGSPRFDYATHSEARDRVLCINAAKVVARVAKEILR